MKRFYLILGSLIAMLLVAAAELRRCSAPIPSVPTAAPPVTSPAPAAQAIASSSTAATLTNDLEIIVPPRRHLPSPDWLKPSRHPEESGVSPRVSAPDDEPIIIRIRQTATAAAISEASASAGVAPVVQDHRESAGGAGATHARLGVIAATMPGILALDYQLARVDVPPWFLGTRLQLGLDAAVNLEAGAMGVTAGGKGFAGMYGWSRWNLSEQGLAAGLGLRF